MTTLEQATRQFPYIAPLVLAYLTGGIVSLVKLRRHTKPAALALVASGMLFLTTISHTFVQSYFVASVNNHELGVSEFEWRLRTVAVVVSLAHVTAFSLMLVAAFAGRRGVSR